MSLRNKLPGGKGKFTSSFLLDIISAPFRALLIAVPVTIASILVLFIFGLLCGAINPLGQVVDFFFNSLSFWNEKWEAAWTLYFSLIIGAAVELSFTISHISAAGRHHNPYAHIQNRAEADRTTAEQNNKAAFEKLHQEFLQQSQSYITTIVNACKSTVEGHVYEYYKLGKKAYFSGYEKPISRSYILDCEFRGSIGSISGAIRANVSREDFEKYGFFSSWGASHEDPNTYEIRYSAHPQLNFPTYTDMTDFIKGVNSRLKKDNIKIQYSSAYHSTWYSLRIHADLGRL